MDNLGDQFRNLTRNATQRFASGGRVSSGGAGGSLIAIAALVGLSYGAYKSIFTVEGGHRAIKFNRIFGVGKEIYSEGLHLAIPGLEKVIMYDVRSRAHNIASLTGSKDLQMVNITLRILHKPNEFELPRIYRELGLNYPERVVPSIANEVLKSVVAQFTAAELLTKRKNVSDLIRKKLIERARTFGILVDDASITELNFGKEYSAAVESKQVAKQQAERAKLLVDKAIEEKNSMIVRAEGDAESIRLVSEAMGKSPGFLELRKIELAKDIADIVANSQNKTYLDSSALLLSLTPKQQIGEQKQ